MMPHKHHLLTDAARIESLRRSGLLDSADEEPFEGVTALASSLLDVPVVLITLVDAERQFFKSCPGLAEPWRSRRETPLSHSFCQHVVRSGAPLVVEDAREHPLVRDNLAIAEIGVIAYAGVPIVTAEGHHLGSLAAIDTVSRQWSERDIHTLDHLARFVSKEIDLRIAAHQSEQEAQHILAESRDKVSGILERINDAFVALDTEWRYTFVNEKAGALFGRDPKSLVGKHIWTEFPERVGQPFHLAYERALREQVPITLEEYYEPWNRWFENRIHPSPEGVSIFFTEITKRKHSEQALRESEALLRQLAESLPQAIWLSLAGGENLYVSPAIEQIWGRPAEEIRRDPSLILADLHPDDRARTVQAFAAITAGESLGVEYRIVRPDGQVRWLFTRGVPVRGENGSIVRIAGVTEDVTARKEAEAERERLLAAEQEAREQLEEQAVELETALSALREASDATGESEARFRSLVEATASIVWVVASSGEVEAPLPEWEAFTGQRFEEHRGWGWLEAIHPEDRERSAAAWSHAVSSLSMYEIEHRLRRADGEYRYMQARGVPVLDGGGNIREWVGSHTDITERKQAAEALHASDARFHAIFDQAAIGIVLVALDGATVALNPAFVGLLGYSEAELRSLRFADVTHPDDLEREMVQFGRLVRGEQSFVRLQKRYLHKDGTVVWADVSGSLLRAADRSPTAVVAVIQDITEQKRAQLALQESEYRYRRFFDDDLTADYISKVDGTIVMCNQAFVHIFGFRDVEEAMLTNIATLFPDPSARDAMLRDLRRKRRLELFESTLRRRDGKEVDIIGNLVGTFDEAGELIEIKGYLFDVTERNALEAQLAQSQKMETVGRLAGGIAHDFNNMLTAIIGNAQILLDQAHDDPDLQLGLREIERAAERSAGLTRQLLAFSRKQVLQPKPLDLNRTITGMESMLHRLIGEHIVITTRLSPDAAEIFVDPSQMEQVILNLVVNARDAMPRGGELTIKTSVAEFDRESAADRDPELGAGRYAVLSISDTGHGIDEATRERIFEPFFTTKPVGQGTGLGLSTVYGIVKQSGGTILVETGVGQGATFVIVLPLLERAGAGISDAAAPTPATRGTETILLVEDDTAVRDLIRRVLQRSGYTVVEATSGVQALRMVEEWERSIDLVLSDVVMPGMSGQETVDALRRSLPEVRVLFMSGYTEDAIQQHGELQPGTGFIEKPFTPETLRRKLREALDEGSD